MHFYFGVLKRVSLLLMIITMALPLLAGCGKKVQFSGTAGCELFLPRDYPRR